MSPMIYLGALGKTLLMSGLLTRTPGCITQTGIGI